MNTATKSFLSLLVLFAAVFTSACTDDGLGSSAQGVSGRPFFELFEGADGDLYFNLAATNHEVVLSSQGYASRQGALAGILSVLENGVDETQYDLREAQNGEFYFVLKAGNGKTIGRSELYSTKSNAMRGITTTADVTAEYASFLATRRGARFSYLQGDNGFYYFQLRAGNGEIVLASQAYSSRAAAMNASFIVAEQGLILENYDILESKGGQGYFNLVAGNGEIIATSEMYYSKSNARRARNSIMELLPNVEML